MRPTVAVIFAASLLAKAQDAPSFAKDIAPIFASNCAGCHGGNARMSGLSLETYETVAKGGSHGKVVEPGKSEQSRLFLMITG